MKLQDILFQAEDNIFSYRIAGLLVRNGKVLLQRPTTEPEYIFPGGHARFGESNEETLKREFKEEIFADVKVERLQWVGEIFFPYGEVACHQLCLFYRISLLDESQVPLSGTFNVINKIDAVNVELEFSWIPLDELKTTALYPLIAKEKLLNLSDDVEHFVYKEA